MDSGALVSVLKSLLGSGEGAVLWLQRRPEGLWESSREQGWWLREKRFLGRTGAWPGGVGAAAMFQTFGFNGLLKSTLRLGPVSNLM